MVVSTLPLEGVIQFSFSVNGVPQLGVSAQATPASTLFRSPATISTGVAVGNINSVSLPITVTAIDSTGHVFRGVLLTRGDSGHALDWVASERVQQIGGFLRFPIRCSRCPAARFVP